MTHNTTASPPRSFGRIVGMLLLSLVLCAATFALIAFVECKISG